MCPSVVIPLIAVDHQAIAQRARIIYIRVLRLMTPTDHLYWLMRGHELTNPFKIWFFFSFLAHENLPPSVQYAPTIILHEASTKRASRLRRKY